MLYLANTATVSLEDVILLVICDACSMLTLLVGVVFVLST